MIEIILLILMLFILVFLYRLTVSDRQTAASEDMKTRLIQLESGLGRLDPLIREEFARNREENRSILSQNSRELNETQRQKFNDLLARQENIKADTEARLREIRHTVDEKLQTTLEKRLSESFRLVSERLEQVHKGLGEMQNLATGVGDLKKVLSNVKTRGILGEIQLANILESILNPEQYEKNVQTRKGSRDNVEYAVKMPGRHGDGHPVYLPIDAKFPVESYHSLVRAYDSGDTEGIRAASKAVEAEIKRCAREIREKYINPPDTTDIGILFLPVEGLYAEVVRQTDLIETLHREYKIIVTGPSTLAAILNSLQMGFRTLAIEKRSGEVWRILGAVKTEISKFGEVLKKAQEKINRASEDIDSLVGARTRKIQSKLRAVQELPENESGMLLESGPAEENTDGDTEENTNQTL